MEYKFSLNQTKWFTGYAKWKSVVNRILSAEGTGPDSYVLEVIRASDIRLIVER